MNKSVYLLINSLEAGGAEALNINLSASIKPTAVILLEDKIEYEVSNMKSNIIALSPFINLRGALKYLITWYYSIKLSHLLRKDPAPHIVLIASLPRSYDVAIRTKKKLADLKKVSVIIWEHASPEYYHRKQFLKKLTQSLYTKADLICANSKNACRYLTESYDLPKEKTAVLYNFFNFETIQTKANEKMADNYEAIFKHKTLLYLGRLHAHKGIEFLLDIFKFLHAKDDSIHLVFVGKGELEPLIRSFIQTNHLASHIHLLGFTSNPFPYLKSASALIFPSESEGFGNVIVESLILHTPVIAADIDNGPREILAPQTDFQLRTTQPEFAELGILLPSITSNIHEQQVTDDWVQTILTFFQSEDIQARYQQVDNNRIQAFNVDYQSEILQTILSKI